MQGDRPEVPNLAFIVIEGEQTVISSASASPKTVADQMRVDGIKIFAVGVGPDVSDKTLEEVSGGPYNYIKAASYAELANYEFMSRCLDIACRGIFYFKIVFLFCFDKHLDRENVGATAPYQVPPGTVLPSAGNKVNLWERNLTTYRMSILTPNR